MKLKYMITVLLPFASLQARYHEVKNSVQLQHLLDQYAYSLVCFAPCKISKDVSSDRQTRDKVYSDFKELKYMLRSAAKQKNYKELLTRDVGFVLADAASNQIHEMLPQYHIDDMPICTVFDHGSQSKQSMVKPASVKDLLKALESVGSTKLQDLLYQRQQDALLQRQEQIAAYYAYGATYPYWGAPYWVYGYGGWGPYGRAGWAW